MNTSDSAAPIWAGTAEVVPHPGNTLLGYATGAYVPVIGVASSSSLFRLAVERAMGALEFRLIGLEDIRQLVRPSDVDALDDVLRDRLGTLTEENPIEVGSFHAFSAGT
jgi:hypothetical protein